MMITGQVEAPHTSVRQQDNSSEAFFTAVQAAFQNAERATGHTPERFYNIGGYTVRLRFAGSALVPRIIPALEHLATEPGPTPNLTIYLWDSSSTTTSMPSPPWNTEDYVTRGEIRGYSNGHIQTAFHIGPNILSLLNTKLNLGIFWIRDAAQVPYYESGAPLRTILHWWLNAHKRQLVHAAAVGTTNGGVLLAGKGGSGKSTTALNCINSELAYASDDYCLIAVAPQPYVYSLYNSAKVNADNTHRIPHLISAISNAESLGEEKALLFLNEHYPEKVLSGFPLRAVLLPRVTGKPQTKLTLASPMAGLRALAPSTIFQLSGAGERAFRMMSQLVKQVPCYNLELGTDIANIPEAIVRLLSKE